MFYLTKKKMYKITLSFLIIIIIIIFIAYKTLQIWPTSSSGLGSCMTMHLVSKCLWRLLWVQSCNAAFRLACHMPHCRFDDDYNCASATCRRGMTWPSGKQHLANRSITLPLCPPRQIADSLILFNSGAMPLGDKARVAWPLRAATLNSNWASDDHTA